MLPHTSGVGFAIISPRSCENKNSAVSLFMYSGHILYKVECCLRGKKILVFLFFLQEEELGFIPPPVFVKKKVRSVAIKHVTLEGASTALYKEQT